MFFGLKCSSISTDGVGCLFLSPILIDKKMSFLSTTRLRQTYLMTPFLSSGCLLSHWPENCPPYEVLPRYCLNNREKEFLFLKHCIIHHCSNVEIQNDHVLSVSLSLCSSTFISWWCQEVARQGSDVSDAADATPPQSRVSSRCKWEPSGYQYDRNRENDVRPYLFRL